MFWYSNRTMRSVADEFRRADQQAIAALSPAQRVRLAFQLGEESLRTYMAYHGVDRETAIARFRGRVQVGRRRSRCLRGEDG